MCKIFDSTYKKNFKTIRVRNCKNDYCPWLSVEIKNCIAHKDKLYRLWKACPNNMAKRLEYTRYRNKTFKLINKAQNLYKKNLLKKHVGNSKKIWEHINHWLGRSKKSPDEVIIQHMGSQFDIQTICSNFAQTFANEVLLLKSQHTCNSELLKRDDYTKVINASIRFIKVTPSQIEKIIDQLENNMSPGFDQIRICDLKEIKLEISPVIAKMINLFVEQSKYHENLKLSIIRPIYKNGSYSETTNYRPIAILSCINKIVEKAITGQIMHFLTKHDVISPSQCGFQKGKSTSTLLSRFANDVNNHLNIKNKVGVIFIDFRKAFDTLDHEVLLKSMENCGIRGGLNDWFRQYLSYRKLTVKVNAHTGKCENVKYGVATGSVTGPTCYIMHVNSMPKVVKHCNIYMFADDTCLMYGHKDLNIIQQCLQQDFDNITRWAHDNGIILNVKKTNIMCISSSFKNQCNGLVVKGHSYNCLHNNVYCTCKPIEQVNECKYLGIIVDCKFSWKKHISLLVGKLRILLRKFHQLKYCVSRSVLYCLYFALVDSLISYGIITYGGSFKTYINKIKQLQIRFLKILVDKKVKQQYKDNYEGLFKKCNVIPVDKKYLLEIAKEEYWDNRYKILLNSKVKTRRMSKGKLFVPKANNNYGKRTKEYLVPKIFNSMSDSTKSVLRHKVCSRNRALKKHFLEHL
ncbi:hypothetical protein JYU34_003848 [Plutella xylostella]|uniref:Reverse transcriptase domain-containing protein n=1 Tax=Plutella xylostella TaxID=51655 RepID=A0ABQ7R141_PLUXY|nr:hypothetical protein JYU34_003848 [Plutella xylostella]